MSIQEQIDNYLASQPDRKRSDMEALHQHILRVMPNCRLWFLDGKDARGKIVSHPNIGYGHLTLNYADGTSKEFYQVGISGNASGISVYLMGIPDRTYLPETYGKSIGKASVTGYCIKFKKLEDIKMDMLDAAIRDAVMQSS